MPKYKVDDILVYVKGEYKTTFKVVAIFEDSNRKTVDYYSANGVIFNEETVKKESL